MMSRKSAQTLAGAGAALAILWSAGAVAQADPLATVVRYHEAVRAAELCDDRTLTDAEQDKIAVQVGQATQHKLPVGQELQGIRAAREHISSLVASKGCKDPVVVDAREFFKQFQRTLR